MGGLGLSAPEGVGWGGGVGAGSGRRGMVSRDGWLRDGPCGVGLSGRLVVTGVGQSSPVGSGG
jgi:hypothetical protein